MLDTIVVEIPIEFRAIIEPSKFRPDARQLGGFKGYGKCTNNK